jgi:heme exporter protein D
MSEAAIIISAVALGINTWVMVTNRRSYLALKRRNDEREAALRSRTPVRAS